MGWQDALAEELHALVADEKAKIVASVFYEQPKVGKTSGREAAGKN
ncbi:hypothetical protein P4S72_18685 [Vibrio sp. PP-XX7]